MDAAAAMMCVDESDCLEDEKNVFHILGPGPEQDPTSKQPQRPTPGSESLVEDTAAAMMCVDESDCLEDEKNIFHILGPGPEQDPTSKQPQRATPARESLVEDAVVTIELDPLLEAAAAYRQAALAHQAAVAAESEAARAYQAAHAAVVSEHFKFPDVATLGRALSSKPYHEAIEDVIRHTAACRADFDRKILLLLDTLHDRGKVIDACAHLKSVLGPMPRDHVVHWRGYLYKLLRDFDSDSYHIVKARLARECAEHLPWIQQPSDHSHLRPNAAPFAPGHFCWVGELRPEDYAKVAAHPLHPNVPEFWPGQLAWESHTGMTVQELEMKLLASVRADPASTGETLLHSMEEKEAQRNLMKVKV